MYSVVYLKFYVHSPIFFSENKENLAFQAKLDLTFTSSTLVKSLSLEKKDENVNSLSLNLEKKM